MIDTQTVPSQELDSDKKLLDRERNHWRQRAEQWESLVVTLQDRPCVRL
jgi:hypothetical protein